PQGFNAVRIVLDGKFKADLSWKHEREVALAYITQGFSIFWEIDLGILKSLHHPLGNRTQFMALSLSLEHFCNTLWKEFCKDTVGLCLYRGALDVSQDYLWDEEQDSNLQEWMHDRVKGVEVDASAVMKYFCADALGEYLYLLSSKIVGDLPLFLLLDATQVED